MHDAETGHPSLTVRQHARHDVALDAELSVAPEQAQAVRFSSSAAGKNGRLQVVLTDISEGGLGVMSTVFVPRHALMDLRVKNPALPEGPAALQMRIRVQRITMTDRRPGYLLGATFADDGPDFAARLDAFLRMLDGESPEGIGAAGAGGGATGA